MFPPEQELLMYCVQKYEEAHGTWMGSGKPLGTFIPKTGLIHALRSRFPTWSVEQALAFIGQHDIEGPYDLALALCAYEIPERVPQLVAYLEWKKERAGDHAAGSQRGGTKPDPGAPTTGNRWDEDPAQDDEADTTRIEELEERLARVEETLSHFAFSLGTLLNQNGVGEIAVRVFNKRRKNIGGQDCIVYDIEYLSYLPRVSRSVQGSMLFCDEDEEPRVIVRSSIDQPLVPGRPLIAKGLGFELRSVGESRDWITQTPFDEMIIELEIDSIVYADGVREDRTTGRVWQGEDDEEWA
ncbi:MAG: hypothetical protein RL885_17945 [Planctomycetota bacterium]